MGCRQFNAVSFFYETENNQRLFLDFCDTCVAVEPSDLKNIKNKVVFSTGCKSARCVADLRIKSTLANIPRLEIQNNSISEWYIYFNEISIL